MASAARSATLHQLKLESGINGAPIYSVSTLSWLRSALKKLPSFVFDSCSLVPRSQQSNTKAFRYLPIKSVTTTPLPLNHSQNVKSLLAKISPMDLNEKSGWF
jgi:hypothetical protein